MSIVHCPDCAAPIDTDNDVDGWIEELGADYCPRCREQHWTEPGSPDMLTELRFFLLDMIHVHHMLKTPVVKPMYEPFKKPVLTREERLELRRRRIAATHVVPRVGRLA